MGFQQRASIAFTFSAAAIDPIVYEPTDPDTVRGDWRRFERTMKGEKAGRNGTYLIAWEQAPKRIRTLATVLDTLGDGRDWRKIQILQGLYDRTKVTADEPSEDGVLVCAIHRDQWHPEVAAREASVDWHDGALYSINPEALQVAVRKSLETVWDFATFHAIECFAVNTESGTIAPIPFVYDGAPQGLYGPPAIA